MIHAAQCTYASLELEAEHDDVGRCRCFSAEVDLTSLQIDVALRKFQSYFQMPVTVFCYLLLFVELAI